MQLQQLYTSKSQIFIDTNGKIANKEFQSNCEIQISEFDCFITMPDYSVIQMNVKEILYVEDKNMYSIEFEEKGYLFVFENKLFLNLTETYSLACEFRLANYLEPNFAEKIVD